MSETCFYCDAPATKLCDMKLGWPIGGFVREGSISLNRFRPIIAMGKLPYTCDRPLCDEHALFRGNIFFCGKEGSVETVDRCHEHAHSDDALAEPITEEEAKNMHRLLHIRLTPPRGKPEVVK